MFLFLVFVFVDAFFVLLRVLFLLIFFNFFFDDNASVLLIVSSCEITCFRLRRCRESPVIPSSDAVVYLNSNRGTPLNFPPRISSTSYRKQLTFCRLSLSHASLWFSSIVLLSSIRFNRTTRTRHPVWLLIFPDWLQKYTGSQIRKKREVRMWKSSPHNIRFNWFYESDYFVLKK